MVPATSKAAASSTVSNWPARVCQYLGSLIGDKGIFQETMVANLKYTNVLQSCVNMSCSYYQSVSNKHSQKNIILAIPTIMIISDHQKVFR